MQTLDAPQNWDDVMDALRKQAPVSGVVLACYRLHGAPRHATQFGTWAGFGDFVQLRFFSDPVFCMMCAKSMCILPEWIQAYLKGTGVINFKHIARFMHAFPDTCAVYVKPKPDAVLDITPAPAAVSGNDGERRA